MSRYYVIGVCVEKLSPGQSADVVHILANDFDIDDANYDTVTGNLTASGDVNIGGGETDDEFARRVAEYIWDKLGKFFRVEVTTTYMEEIPYEAHYFEEDSYGEYRKSSPIPSADTGNDDHPRKLRLDETEAVPIKLIFDFTSAAEQLDRVKKSYYKALTALAAVKDLCRADVALVYKTVLTNETVRPIDAVLKTKPNLAYDIEILIPIHHALEDTRQRHQAIKDLSSFMSCSWAKVDSSHIYLAYTVPNGGEDGARSMPPPGTDSTQIIRKLNITNTQEE